MKKLYLLLFLANLILSQFSAISTPLVYKVRTPVYTRECYLVGDMNAWRFIHSMTRVAPGMFELEIEDATPAMRYKYCMDSSWDHVEVDATGNDIESREYMVADSVCGWKDYTLAPGLYISGDFNNWTDIDKMAVNEAGIYLFFKTFSPGVHYYWIFDEKGCRNLSQIRRLSVEKEQIVSFYARTPDRHFSNIDSLYMIGPAVSDWDTPVMMTRESAKLTYRGEITPFAAYKIIKHNADADIRWDDITHYEMLTPPGVTDALEFDFKTFEINPISDGFDPAHYLLCVHSPTGDTHLQMEPDAVAPNIRSVYWHIPDDGEERSLTVRDGYMVAGELEAVSMPLDQVPGYQTGDIQFFIDCENACPINNYNIKIRAASALPTLADKSNLQLAVVEGGLQVTASDKTTFILCDVSGRKIIQQILMPGSSFFALPVGIYFANNQKVMVY